MVKGHAGVKWGQGSNCSGRPYDNQILLDKPSWGQSSCRGHPGSNCLWSPNLVRKTHGQSVKGHAVVDWGQPDTNCPETHKPANVANVTLFLLEKEKLLNCQET